MDPAAAIGLAVNIMTVIDLGCKVIAQAEELYQSGRGSTQENARIGTIVGDLREYSLELSTSRNYATKHERAIEALGKDCAEASDQLIAILEKLKMAKKSRWKSLTTTWTAFRKKNDIAALEARLGEYRAQISLRLMAALNDKHSGLKSQLDNIELEAEKMASVSATELKLLREDIICLLTPPEQNSGGPPAYSLDDVGKRLGSLQSAAGTTQRETRVLQKLYFSDIHVREDAIKDANEKTFNWILEPGAEGGEGEPCDEVDFFVRKQMGDRKKARTLLQSWLASGSGALHISGKAGAGKSTLMKLLYNHPRTKELLHEWAGEKSLVFVPFFFWNSGSKLQKSVEGLYRSLLYHVLAQCPALIPKVLPHLWRSVPSSPHVEASPFDIEMIRPPDIKDAFERLLGMPISLGKFRFCFFIDGLDEFKGHAYEHKQLAVQLRDWTKCEDIKVCVSSRPHFEFIDTFPSELRLHLHELTASDMWNLGCDLFEKDENLDRVRGTYKELVHDVVSQAEGVLLWASIVFRTVLREVGLHSPFQRLKQKILNLPREMNDLYDRMFFDLDPADRHVAGQMLYLTNIDRNHNFNPVCMSWLDDMTEPSFPSASHLGRITSEEDIRQCRDAMTRQISGVTSGLLATHAKQRSIGYSHETKAEIQSLFYVVEFFHRTVRDWLDTATMRRYKEEAYPELDFSGLLLRLRIAEMCLAHISWPEMNRSHLGLEAGSYTLQDPDPERSCYHTPKDVELYYDRLGPNFLPIFQPLFRNHRLITGHAPGRVQLSASFVHHAVISRQQPYVQRKIEDCRDLGRQAESCLDPPVYDSGKDMSLMFSAACDASPRPEMVSMLLSAGFSTKFRLHLFQPGDQGGYSRTGSTISFWTAWVAQFFSTASSIVLNRPQSGRQCKFDIMELLLRASPQHEVIYLSYRGYEIISLSLRDIIRQCHPGNMDQLLELLPPDSHDSSEWPHVKEFKGKWGYDGPDDKESDPHRMDWAILHGTEEREYNPQLGVVVGVASKSEILTMDGRGREGPIIRLC